jgi:hypothetical protein
MAIDDAIGMAHTTMIRREPRPDNPIETGILI